MEVLPAEIIKLKRNGVALNERQIQQFILGFTNGKIPDYQMSALLMAIYFQGMNTEETIFLTKAMLHSGEIVQFSDVPEFKVDKHSTGGVGDKTSMILGPIVAACGVPVPMISGRGLGHTGGTLDKLESIPGFNTQKNLKEFIAMIKKNKISFIGQTQEICPADKKMYALRDVTATVESLPLICASIMSKKLAEGIDGLVLDVKFGSGAFMKTIENAEKLANQLMSIAQGNGKKVVSLLTNMNQPLGRYAGNSLEIFECVQIMKGETHLFYNETRELSLQLSAHMLAIAGVTSDEISGYELAKIKLDSGEAFKKFQELCLIHGGNLSALPLPTEKLEIVAEQAGYVSEMNTEVIGISGILVKAGRAQVADQINPVSGIEFHCKVGTSVKKGDLLFTMWGDNYQLLSTAKALLKSTVTISEKAAPPIPLIAKILKPRNIHDHQ